MVYTQKGDYHEKTKKKKIILTTIQILFVAFIGYYTYTLNRPGIHFIGNFAKFNVDKDYTMRVYQNEKEIESKTVNVKIKGKVNGFTKRFRGNIIVEGIGTDEIHPDPKTDAMEIIIDSDFDEYGFAYSTIRKELNYNERGEAMPNPSRYQYQINGNKFKQKFKLTIMDFEENITYEIEQ